MNNRVLILGSGDIGSAVAVRLFQSGYQVAIHESGKPAATRRGMALTDAVFGGQPSLDGMQATLTSNTGELVETLRAKAQIPVTSASFDDVLQVMSPDVLIDARMRKRVIPDDMRALVGVTIGLGPNFVAGENCHIAIETSWDDLGRVITDGPALEFRGEPRPIGGAARERYVYSPATGVFRTTASIGAHVQAGDTIASVDDVEIQAPLTGVLRGLTHDGVPVTARTKVVEVDPRDLDTASIFGIAERPEKIARGVLRALDEAGRSR